MINHAYVESEYVLIVYTYILSLHNKTEYNTILHFSSQRRSQNLDHTVNSGNMPHKSFSRTMYGVSIVRIWRTLAVF